MTEPEGPAIPRNLEAEHALLGIALFDNEAVRRVNDRIRPEHFCEPFHQRLWEAVSVAVSADKLADPITMQERFKADPSFLELGGLGFLMELVDRAPPATGAEDYAAEVFNTWARRSLLDLAQRASKAAYAGVDAQGTSDPFEMIASARRDLEAIEHAAAPGDELFVDARTSAFDTLEAVETDIACGKPRGLPCGIAAVDRRLGGLFPEDLIVIAGRPGMGKTALLGNILYGAAQHSPSKLFAGFSLEMGARQLSSRALSRLTADDDEPVHYERISKSTVNSFELQRLHEVKRFVPENLLLRDRPGLSVEAVARAVWALKRRGDLGAIGIDYLQIMRRPTAKGRNEASVIAEMTAALKTLAREARITIILLSQLSRAVEQRDDKRPMLSDLRESGSIEQDADVVLFPFREIYYLQRAEPTKPEARQQWEMDCAEFRLHLDVIGAKNRHGGLFSQPQVYDPAVDSITDKKAGGARE